MLLLGTNYDNMVSDSCINEDMAISFLISYEWRYDRGHINNENYHFVQILWLWSTTLCKCNLCCYFCDRTYLNSVCVSDLVHWVFVTNNIGCLYPHSQQINFRFGYNCYYKITVKWFEIIRFKVPWRQYKKHNQTINNEHFTPQKQSKNYNTNLLNVLKTTLQNCSMLTFTLKKVK